LDLRMSTMRVLVVGSCGKSKSKISPCRPQCKDLRSKDSLLIWQKRLSDQLTPAREMYTGHQNRELLRGIDTLRRIPRLEVHLLILSAGFGILSENELVPPYDCSFSKMKTADIQKRAKTLGNSESFRTANKIRYDLTYLALGKKYLTALGDDYLSATRGTVVSFDRKAMHERLVYVPSGSVSVRSFSSRGFKIHGVVGFKGDLLRILADHALRNSDQHGEVVAWTDPSYLEELIYELGDLDPPVIN
ncbi:MAG: DUF6884 domain-containing protein, partial [Candidatus Thorarchaeota archaeon]